MTSETLLPEGRKISKLFLQDIQDILVPFNNYRRKKRILEKVMFYFELWNIISISCVAWSHGNRNNIEYVF